MRDLINAGIESQGPSFPWEIWNRGKRSIALDLRQDRARAIVLGLAEQADVFLTSYLPATRAKLGLDIANVQARNPETVHACGTVSGPRGEAARTGGYAAISFLHRRGATGREKVGEISGQSGYN